MTKESLARMLNQIIVSFLDLYKKAKDVVSLFKMQIYGVFFILSFLCLTREFFYLGFITNPKKGRVKALSKACLDQTYLVYKVCGANKK